MPQARPRRRARHGSVLAVILCAALLAGCGKAPHYPADWPPLAPPQRAQKASPCPDLSGSYGLPRVIKVRSNGKKERLHYPHNMLTARAGQDAAKRMRSHGPLSRMVLQGPADGAMTVAFYDRKDQLVSEHVLKADVDYRCRGAWISDARASHTRATPQLFYDRDTEGRLVGHTAHAGAGVLPLLGVIPVPFYVDDRDWWRLEPADRAAPP